VLRGALMAGIRACIAKVMQLADVDLEESLADVLKEGREGWWLRIESRSASLRKSADYLAEEGPSLAFAGRWAKKAYQSQGTGEAGWLTKHKSRAEYTCADVNERLVRSGSLGTTFIYFCWLCCALADKCDSQSIGCQAP
jgi:hypothetical protein